MQESQTQFFDLYRSGLRTMNDLMKSSLETTERLQNQQLQQVRSALEETNRSTGQLGDIRSLDELLAAQAKLAGSQVQRTMDFWSSVWRAAGDSHIALISQMQSLTSRATQDVVRLATSQVSTIGNAAREAGNTARETAAQAERSAQQHRKAG
ncbi:MAG TPA: phasin family protein [Burkholderiales bacterium]|nr:phasin family protein [Burkholderiales bacterium]